MKVKIIIIIVLLIVNNLFSQSFDNILLIINYNHAHYSSMTLLQEIYEPYFENIVFYGPKKHSGVHHFEHNKGYFSYLCIADAIKRYPNFDGYLFLHDDCILNAWKLKNIDTSRIWFCEMPYIFGNKGDVIDLTRGENAFPEWSWWKTEWGWKAVEKTYKKIPKYHKEVLERTHGKNRVLAGFSDFVYIPAKYKKKFVRLASIFGKYNTFLELSIPTILACLCPSHQWVWLKGNHTHLNYHDSYKNFNLDVYFNHPIKLSFEQNCIFISELFNEMLNVK